MTCILIAAVITCTGTAPRLTPAEAVRVLTASTRPFVYVAPAPRDYPRELPPVTSPETGWPYHGSIADLPPTRPLAAPWRVTTTIRHGVVETWFNGKNMR
jgi:hypothetical protein